MELMLPRRFQRVSSRIIGYGVLLYGLLIIASTFRRQLEVHRIRDLDALLISLPLLIGLGYVYLANLLLRLKYNAWLMSCVLSGSSVLLELFTLTRHGLHHRSGVIRLVISLGVLGLLIVSRKLYRVRSDMVRFTEALRVSVVILLITFLYGVGGFTLLDRHDFHQEISLSTAVHQTVDQFGLTTKLVTPHTRRAVLFVDSLSVVSIGAIIYIALAFFQPLRMRLTNESKQREAAQKLLETYPSDIDDYFKLWPHDKHFFFDKTAEAALAYHVNRGVALVVGDPFGNKKRFSSLLKQFQELCFVNDWMPSFLHVSQINRALYERNDYRLQKIGEEAVLDLAAFQTVKNDKYFRQIRNRFTKLGYSVEVLQPPHSPALLKRLQQISEDWLERPGRAERGLLLGYHSDEYLQQCQVAVVRDEAQQIQGFVNVVPTFEPQTANYDLLRCSDNVPGNCNDFLLLGLFEILYEQGIRTFNLGLCPLAGLDQKAEDASLIDTALRFAYANGDRFYSFSGLHRFKAKYKPAWHARYIAYRGGIPAFTRVVAALNRAMKVHR